MKKLQLDSIQVESFETSEVVESRGTVEGNVAATLSCAGSCKVSCNATDCGSCQSGTWCC